VLEYLQDKQVTLGHQDHTQEHEEMAEEEEEEKSPEDIDEDFYGLCHYMLSTY
jgi:phosphoribosyl 1,2-cyclic phosphodiesterase